jgi:hypothetical protein
LPIASNSPDDRKARKLAEDLGHALTQTTPHLFSWLIFKGLLGDSDKPTVITQHQSMERLLAPHFETAYEMALQLAGSDTHWRRRDVTQAACTSCSAPCPSAPAAHVPPG